MSSSVAKIGTADSNGNVNILYGGGYAAPGLAVDGNGAAYFVGFGSTITKVTLDGTTTVVPGTQGITWPGGDIAIDSTGALYGTSYDVHTFHGIVQKVAGGKITRVAGGMDQNSLATEAPLTTPRGIAVLPGGDQVVADYILGGPTSRMRRIAPNGQWRLLNSPALDASNDPPSAVVLQGGSIHALVRDSPNWKIIKFNADDSSEIEIRIKDSGQLAVGLGLAADGKGGYYIAGKAAGGPRTIWKVSPDGTVQQLLPLPSISSLTSYWANALDVCTDDAGNLFIAQGTSILKMTPAGLVTTVAGDGHAGFTGDNGPATAAQLNGATGIAIDSAGNLLIADMFNRRIRMVTPDGIIRTVAVTGPPQETNDVLGYDPSSWMDGPLKVVVDNAGNIYYSELANGLVRKLTPNPPTGLTASSGDTQQAAGGSALSSPLTVKVMGQVGVPVEGVLITWKVSSGAATLNSATSITDSAGLARIAVTLGATPGPVAVTATATGLPPVQFTATATDSPAQLKITSGNDQSGAPGSALVNPLVVQVSNHSGAPMPGVTVAFSVTSGAATLSAATAQTAADGTAKVSVTLGASAGPVVITATVAGLPAIQFQLTALAGPTITAVAGAGGSVPPVARISPGGLATVYGANFAVPGTSRQVQAADMINGNLPTQLAGVCVTFNQGSTSVGAAGVTYVSPAQVNFQVPSLPLNTALSMVVSVNCGTASVQTAAQNVTADEASPEFLYWVKSADGRNPVIAVNSVTGAYVGRAGLIAGASFTPAKPGDYLTVYGISFGPTTPAVAPGSSPSATASTANVATVVLGTVTLDAANVLYAGVSPGSAGLYQLNVRVPAGLTDGDYPISLRLGSFVTPPGGYITVQNVPVNDFSFEQLILPSEGFGVQPAMGTPSFSFPSNYAGWSFTGHSGETLAGTIFNPPGNIPDGLKAAYLQGNGAAVSQAVSGLKPSVTYAVSLYVGTRYHDGGGYDGNTSVDVRIGGAIIGTTGLLPSSSPFSRYSFTFTVSTPGSHNLSISNSGPSGDHTAFVDSVSITDTVQP